MVFHVIEIMDLFESLMKTLDPLVEKKKKVYYKSQVQLGSNYILHFYSKGNSALLKRYVSIHSQINSCFPKHQWYYRFLLNYFSYVQAWNPLLTTAENLCPLTHNHILPISVTDIRLWFEDIKLVCKPEQYLHMYYA